MPLPHDLIVARHESEENIRMFARNHPTRLWGKSNFGPEAGVVRLNLKGVYLGSDQIPFHGTLYDKRERAEAFSQRLSMGCRRNAYHTLTHTP